LAPFQFGAYEGKRLVASFGSRYDYNHHKLEPADDFPVWIRGLREEVEEFACLPAASIGQVLFTKYDAGVGIGWHRDKPHFDQVFVLSLASSCKFRFRRKTGRTSQRFTLDAEPCSLYLMSGEARSVWEHSIPPVETARYSVTFRTMNGEEKRASR
jgi:alkylated DNA repair dioxygenase AlkB